MVVTGLNKRSRYWTPCSLRTSWMLGSVKTSAKGSPVLRAKRARTASRFVMESPSIGLRVAIVNSRSKEPRGCWAMPLPVRSRGVAAPFRRARRERRSLKTLHARNLFLSQCLSAKAEKAMVWNHQLPECQQKSLSWLPDCYTADPVPNSKKRKRKWRSWRGTEEGDVSRQCAIADLDSGGHLQRLWTKACNIRTIHRGVNTSRSPGALKNPSPKAKIAMIG